MCNDEVNSSGIFCFDCYKNIDFIGNRCRTCGESLEYTNLKIKTEICNACISGRSNWFLNEIYSLFTYQNSGRKIILKLKTNDTQFIYEVLSELAVTNGRKFFENIDFIVPIHLHWFKKLIRGFDQAQLLAFSISKVLKIPLKTNILYKTKNTAPQHSQSYYKRFSNINNSFFIKNSDIIKNKNILLIDDVITSGATSNQCAKLLKLQSANSVKLFTLARTLTRETVYDY